MAAPSNDTVDLRAVFQKIGSRWWWFLITVPIAVALGAAFIKTTAKQYVVQATMLLSENKRSGYGGDEEFIKGTAYLSNSADLK